MEIAAQAAGDMPVRRSSLRGRLWVGMAVLLIGLGAVLLFLSYRASQVERLRGAQRNASGLDRIAVAWLTEQVESWPDVKRRAEMVAKAIDAEVRIYDEPGVLRVQAVPPSMLSESGWTWMSSHSFDLGDDLQGRIEMRANWKTFTVGRSRWWVGSLFAMAGALLGAWLVAARVVAPIQSFGIALKHVDQDGRHGELPAYRYSAFQYPTYRYNDEVGDLVRSFETAYSRSQEDLANAVRDRDQLTAVLSGMSEGVLAVDREERLLHVNQTALDILDVPKEPAQVRGLPILEVTRESHVLQAVAAVLEEDRDVLQTYTRSSSGALGETDLERTIELSARRLHRTGSDVTPNPAVGDGAGAVVVLHDITRLERLEGLRRDFVSNVSHELKTPLTAIRGFVETLLDSEDVDEATRHRFLSRVKVQTSRLSSLVGDLLSLSRIESGNMEIASKPLDVRPIVAETLLALRPKAEDQGATVESVLPDRPVLVFAEAEALRQAFSNLVGNAIKYSEPGGRVFVRLRSESTVAVFEVEDFGPGIEERYLERIFERFYRVDKARSRALGGTGLGLAIVKNVATALGGRVEVASELGAGSTFRMILPLGGLVDSRESSLEMSGAAEV